MTISSDEEEDDTEDWFAASSDEEKVQPRPPLLPHDPAIMVSQLGPVAVEEVQARSTGYN